MEKVIRRFTVEWIKLNSRVAGETLVDVQCTAELVSDEIKIFGTTITRTFVRFQGGGERPFLAVETDFWGFVTLIVDSSRRPNGHTAEGVTAWHVVTNITRAEILEWKKNSAKENAARFMADVDLVLMAHDPDESICCGPKRARRMIDFLLERHGIKKELFLTALIKIQNNGDHARDRDPEFFRMEWDNDETAVCFTRKELIEALEQMDE